MPTPFGKYTLLRKLGEGGMAEVFLARQPGDDGQRLVVVKRILPHLNDEPQFVRMFVNEARIAARLRHDAIARIYDLGRVGQSHFMALEYVHGEDMAHVAKRADRTGLAPLPLSAAAKIVSDVCAGLGAAHAATDVSGRPLGIVHRDVSPQNVMVTFDGRVKVIDFGVAKATALAGETRAGMMKGKYAYMSPEQVRGEKIDNRADVFAVGIMLWELAAWRRLFKRDADWLTMRAVVEDPIPPASTFRPEGGPELDAILSRALARDRDQRYPSCEALAEDLLELAARKRWDVSQRELARLMGQLFADRLAAQKQSLEQAQARSVEDFLLRSDESTKLEWMPAPSAADEDSGGGGATVVSGGGAPPSGAKPPPIPGGARASGRRFALPPPEKTAVAMPEATPTPMPSYTPTPSASSSSGSAVVKRRGSPVIAALGAIAILGAGAAGGFLIMKKLRGGNGDAAADAKASKPAPGPVAPAPAREPVVAPSPETPPEAKAPPRLVLRGQPGVLVFIDGRRRGETPLTVDDLAFDRPHAITLMKDGFRDGKVELAPIPSGDHVVDVNLEPLGR